MVAQLAEQGLIDLCRVRVTNALTNFDRIIRYQSINKTLSLRRFKSYPSDSIHSGTYNTSMGLLRKNTTSSS